ncbi:hypothetical protein D3C85_1869800 [compost metagenome]
MLPIAQTNVALGIKILLNSFASKPDGKLGQVGEPYVVDNIAIKAAHEHMKSAERILDHRKSKPVDKHNLLTLL